jgi:hypothetical protein
MYKRIIWVLYLAIKAHTWRRFESSNHYISFIASFFLVTQKVYFHAGILVRENRYAILLIINQTIYNMDKNKIHGFMDQLNLFLIGAIIGGIIGSCFSINLEAKSKVDELIAK